MSEAGSRDRSTTTCWFPRVLLQTAALNQPPSPEHLTLGGKGFQTRVLYSSLIRCSSCLPCPPPWTQPLLGFTVSSQQEQHPPPSQHQPDWQEIQVLLRPAPPRSLRDKEARRPDRTALFLQHHPLPLILLSCRSAAFGLWSRPLPAALGPGGTDPCPQPSWAPLTQAQPLRAPSCPFSFLLASREHPSSPPETCRQ